MRHKGVIVAILTAAFLFLALALWLGPQNFVRVLSEANPQLLGLALLVEIVDLVILTARWHIFLTDVTDIKFSTALGISIAGIAISNLTPGGRIGGEPLKAYILKKRYGIDYGTSFATIILERIADMLAFLVIAIVALFYGVLVFHLPSTIIILLLLALLSNGLVLFGLWYFTLKRRVKSKTILEWLDRHPWIERHFPIVSKYKENISSALLSYYSGAAKMGSNPKTFILGFLTCLVYWLVEISRAYIIFLALGVNPPFPIIALAYIFSTIAGSVPFGVGGVGLIEGTMIFIYSAGAINTVVASLETLIDRFLSYWLVILIGLPLAGYLGISKRVEEVDEDGGLHDSTSEGSKER